MTVYILALLIAALAGVTMAVQGTVNSVLGKAIGLLETTLLVNAAGLVLTVILLYVFRLGGGDWHRYSEAPWYAYLGGVLGVIITYAVVRSIPEAGVANATTAIMLTATLIDHAGLWGMKEIPFTWHRVVGAVLMAVGAWFLLRR